MIRYDIDNWRFSVNATKLFDTQFVAAYAQDGIKSPRSATVGFGRYLSTHDEFYQV